MKNTSPYLIIILAILFQGCYGSENTCTSNVPKKLIEEFNSYQTIQDFTDLVKIKTDSIILFENSKLAETDTRPEFSIYSIILPEYEVGNAIGKLRASFFNDRLVSIWFYPNNINQFDEKLKKKYNISLRNGENKTIDCVRINRYTDFEGNEYFGWSDLKLVKEQNDWISQNA
tara:strand:- start:40 stop:558 length:519 start_codon:yes stop_codon:yes gene_type:complete